MRELLKEIKKEIQEGLLLEKLEFKAMMKNKHFWQVQLLNILKIMMFCKAWLYYLELLAYFEGIKK